MHDLLIRVVFYVFAGLALLSAFFVITQTNPVRSVLCLVATFFATAALWLLVSAEFLALILILVYVGAVMTLFLFVVMMLNVDREALKAPILRYLPFALILVALLLGLLLVALPEDWLQGGNGLKVIHQAAHRSNTEAIGLVLYTNYVFAFELAAVLLLVAIISAIMLAHRPGLKHSKRQDIRRQLMTSAKDRLSLVDLQKD